MNKERLGEFEELLNEYYENIDEPFAATDIAISIVEKSNWLLAYAKEQAERMHKLEEDIETLSWDLHKSMRILIESEKELESFESGERRKIKKLNQTITRLSHQNKRCHKALEFYGNQFNYANHAQVIKEDFGETARKELEHKIN